MKRAGLLYSAAVDAQRFNLLKQRDQLPFSIPANGEAAGWTNYTLDDAFRLRVMLDMVGGEGAEGIQRAGLAPSYMQGVLENLLIRFERSPLESMEPGLWGAVAVLEEQGTAPQDGAALRYTEWFAGKLADLPEWMAERCEASNAVPVRIFTVNVSRAAQFVRNRANELGLPEALEFSGQ